VNKLFVLRDSSSTGVRRPVRRGWVAEADIDVGIVLNFLELMRHVVGEEYEIYLRIGVRLWSILRTKDKSVMGKLDSYA